jgi:hypothetical protein
MIGEPHIALRADSAALGGRYDFPRHIKMTLDPRPAAEDNSPLLTAALVWRRQATINLQPTGAEFRLFAERMHLLAREPSKRARK